MGNSIVHEYLRRPYARIIVPDDEGRYAAQILEFPGCYSEGESPDDAYRNLEEAAQNWIESALDQGLPIPPPSAGQGYSGVVSLRLPKALHRRAAALAHRDGVSLNQFLVTAVATRIGAENVYDKIASKLDDRLDRLQSTEWVGVEGIMRQIPVAATGKRRADVPVIEWGLESSKLTTAKSVLRSAPEGEIIDG
jgi:predicted RNase H-like HicB family nuclease